MDHVFKVDKYVVPADARDQFVSKVKEFSAHLAHQPGFVKDTVLEKTGGPGEFNIVTVAEWEDESAIAAAKAVMQAIHARSGFDAKEFMQRLGIRSDIADYREVG